MESVLRTSMSQRRRPPVSAMRYRSSKAIWFMKPSVLRLAVLASRTLSGSSLESAHAWACAVRDDDESEAEVRFRSSHRTLAKAVRDAVGEMCPHPAPATAE